MSTDTTEQLQDLAQSPAEEAVQAPAKTSSISPDELARLSDDVVAALKTVYDPEIPADIFELGLIYKIDIEDDRMVKIVMTLTEIGRASCRERV